MVVIAVIVAWFAFKSGEQNGMQSAAVGTSQVKDETLANYISQGKAKQVTLSSKMASSLSSLLLSYFTGTTPMPNAYMYYCRGNDGAGFLYETQINLGTSYQSQSSSCVQVQA